jgi:hypothetical protein
VQTEPKRKARVRGFGVLTLRVRSHVPP